MMFLSVFKISLSLDQNKLFNFREQVIHIKNIGQVFHKELLSDSLVGKGCLPLADIFGTNVLSVVGIECALLFTSLG